VGVQALEVEIEVNVDAERSGAVAHADLHVPFALTGHLRRIAEVADSM